ncbi:hypothetical protein [Massilia antarctica]|uniref:hypothetical protein n=1 Tax=Massilia antarctica TaxID=2765360 RepID=UPI0006BB5C9E|nr:hypothetical protein [Massilia sp. H27-R4]MCY0916465.1 hypothetical protein [Massilia sp. H27-R4]CUI07396.1 hypothetical protein BN2497_9569 [Janthinobacterium sp. CG23_2]CUU31182.1 hypothetical protein BN3177_9569 [Janthinobacterium sp. CG23_2]
MTMHIERMTSDVSLHEGDIALTQQQIDKFVALVISKLEDRAREAQRARGATQIKRGAAPPFGAGR